MWPWRRRPERGMEWARKVVAAIPRQDLVNHAETFADCALKATDPQKRAMHWAKFRAAMGRLEREARFDG